MTAKVVVRDAELANGWPISRVYDSLQAGDKAALLEFISQRYEERFFAPIRTLRDAPSSHEGFGFAIIALCSLLVESLQCLREGLPTTHSSEYERIQFIVPPEYEIPTRERKNGLQVFVAFFARQRHKDLFGEVNGETFYRAIRNGLLHQAQTKFGWTIRICQPALWNDTAHILDRNRFSDALATAFRQYIDELSSENWDSDDWKMAQRKIWWIAQMSR